MAKRELDTSALFRNMTGHESNPDQDVKTAVPAGGQAEERKVAQQATSAGSPSVALEGTDPLDRQCVQKTYYLTRRVYAALSIRKMRVDSMSSKGKKAGGAKDNGWSGILNRALTAYLKDELDALDRTDAALDLDDRMYLAYRSLKDAELGAKP